MNHTLGLWVALVAAVPCLAFFPIPVRIPAALPRPRPTRPLQMSSLTAPPAPPGAEEAAKRAIVVVGLNGALQRTIVFKPPKGLHVGHVNRASSVGQGIGGKGQNVCVALRKLAECGDGAIGEGGDVDVTLAHFAGGKSGESRHH